MAPASVKKTLKWQMTCTELIMPESHERILRRIIRRFGSLPTTAYSNRIPSDVNVHEERLWRVLNLNKARRRPSDAIELNWTVQTRLLVCGGLQLVRDDRELFLLRFKFRIAVQSRRLVCAVLQLARNKLFICNRYSQSKCRGMSPDAKYVCIITLGGTFLIVVSSWSSQRNRLVYGGLLSSVEFGSVQFDRVAWSAAGFKCAPNWSDVSPNVGVRWQIYGRVTGALDINIKPVMIWKRAYITYTSSQKTTHQKLNNYLVMDSLGVMPVHTTIATHSTVWRSLMLSSTETKYYT